MEKMVPDEQVDILNSTTHYVSKYKNWTISRFPKWLVTWACNSLKDKSSNFLSGQMFRKSCGRHCVWGVNDLGQAETALWGLLRRGMGEVLTVEMTSHCKGICWSVSRDALCADGSSWMLWQITFQPVRT